MDRPRTALKDIDKTLLDEAYLLVTNDRNHTYDHPAVNFRRIADLWSVVLGVKVDPDQVGMCMVMVKLAREIHEHKRDNIVDSIGYLLTMDAAR
jgi:hypothetical protein